MQIKVEEREYPIVKVLGLINDFYSVIVQYDETRWRIAESPTMRGLHKWKMKNSFQIPDSVFE